MTDQAAPRWKACEKCGARLLGHRTRCRGCDKQLCRLCYKAHVPERVAYDIELAEKKRRGWPLL